jgi:hypothetical protein
MTSSKNNGFTANDIERYHTGKMLPQERHALEKAALDDPFLADALEGYSFTSSPVEDLAKIQSKLDEKLNRRKVVPIFEKYKWISVAAIVLIIAGGGWLVYSISGSGKSTDIALQREKDSSANSNNSSPNQTFAADSTNSAGLANQQLPLNNAEKTEADANATKNNGSEINQKKHVNSDKEITASKKEAIQEVTAPAAIQTEVAGNNSFANVEQKRGANNKISSPDARTKAASEDIPARAPAVKDMPSAKTAATGKANGVNDTIKNMNVVLQPLPMDSASLQAVVIGYGKQKKSAEKYPRVIIDTLEPAEGYVKFDDYITSNLKAPEELKVKSLSGEVQLAFDVDKNGQPVNITVVKSLCQTCDEEAIRLLKEGPKWKKKKNKKGKLTIRF